jgi:hypothetical protein
MSGLEVICASETLSSLLKRITVFESRDLRVYLLDFSEVVSLRISVKRRIRLLWHVKNELLHLLERLFN